MSVRLLKPYNGQNAGTLYFGTDEATLRAVGIADDYIELATNYVSSGAQAFRALATTFSTTAPAGSFVTSLSNPFAGQGRGFTTYATQGSVPAQLALSASSRSLVIGASAGTADTIYPITLVATSGDGLLTSQPVTLNLKAVERLTVPQPGVPGVTPTPSPTPTPTPSVLAPPAAFAARWTPNAIVTLTSGSTLAYAATMTGAPVVPAEGSANTTYYRVDPVNGNDTSGTGSVGSPYKSMGKINALAASAAAGQNIVGVYTLAADYIARSSEGWNNVAPVANVYHVNSTPQFRYLSAKTNGVNTTWSVLSGTPGTPGVIYQGTRSSAPLGIIDTAIKTMPWRIKSGGSGYTVGDTVTLSNGAVIVVTGVTNGEVATASGTGAISNWTVSKRASAMTVDVTATGGTGSGAIFGTHNANAPIVDDVATLAASAGAIVPGTWFDDGTNVLYAPLNGRSLNLTANGELAVCLTVTGNNGRGSITPGNVTYVGDGFSFLGGSMGFADNPLSSTAGNRTLYFGRGSITGVTGAGNGLAAQGDVTVWGQNHYCYYCGRDGHNFHNDQSTYASGAYTAFFSKGFLLNCGGMGNGMTGSAGTSDQDLTAHESSIVAAPNYESCTADDQPIAVVGQAYLWMPGGFAAQANQTTPAGSKQSVAALAQLGGAADNATIWLDGVTIPFGLNGRVTAQGSPRTIYYRNMVGTMVNDPADTGNAGGIVATY